MTAPIVRIATAALLVAGFCLPARAAPALAPGAAMPELQFSDQNDRPLRVDAATRRLIFAADKAASELAQGVLKAEPAGVLDRLHAVYLADISGMPALITKMFALPKLRELTFAVGIVRDAAQTAMLPRRAGQVTVLVLEGGTVLQVLHAGAADELKRALGL